MIFSDIKNLYEKIGYQVLAVSSKDQTGIKTLTQCIQGKVNLFSGQSGVGKSSIINSLQPDLKLKTSQLSGYSGKGIHTTTFAEMFPVNKNTFIIDTPGIKSLSFNNLGIMDVAHNYREFFEASVDCKFGSQCTHRNEPDCAVKEKMLAGMISEVRYKNYLNVLEEIDAQNYWERNKKYWKRIYLVNH